MILLTHDTCLLLLICYIRIANHRTPHFRLRSITVAVRKSRATCFPWRADIKVPLADIKAPNLQKIPRSHASTGALMNYYVVFMKTTVYFCTLLLVWNEIPGFISSHVQLSRSLILLTSWGNL